MYDQDFWNTHDSYNSKDKHKSFIKRIFLPKIVQVLEQKVYKFKHTLKHMVKTITIMNDAYEVLKRLKKKDESFSDVIRRVGNEQKTDLTRWVGVLKGDKQRVREFQTSIRKTREEVSADVEKRNVHF